MNNYSYKIQYVGESLALLNILSHPAPYVSTYMAESADKHGIVPGPEEKKLVEELSSIEEDARKEFKDDLETIGYYFSSKGQFVISFVNILFVNEGSSCPFDDITDNISVKDYKKYLSEIDENKYNKFFYQMVKSIESNSSEGDDKEDVSSTEIFDAIFEADLSDSDKLKLQKLYLHRQEHIDILFPLLDRAAKIIKKHEKKLEAFGQRTIEYTKKEVGKEPFIEFIMKKLSSGDTTEENTYPKDSIIHISYLQCSKISFSIRGDSLESSLPRVLIGAIFSDSLTFDSVIKNRNMLTEERALTILKLLSDKSKLEILELTKNEAMYGAQLANKLGLTTATISHHTSALFDQNLLHIEKVDSKIYFKQYQETIKALIRYLESTLLN